MKQPEDHFSKSASTYDRYADIQNYASRRVLGILEALPEKKNYRHILDVGCGTGSFTADLLEKYPQALGVGLDIAPDMITWAKQHYPSHRLQFVLRPLSELSPEAPFDLVVSNAAFQWMPTLSLEFQRLKQMMTPHAPLVFSIFTRETYTELKQALSMVMGKPVILASSAFLEPLEIDRLVKAQWKKGDMHYEKVQIQFPSLKSLLQTIKFTGTRGQGVPDAQWTPGFFQEVEAAYRLLFGQIKVTYGLGIGSAYD